MELIGGLFRKLLRRFVGQEHSFLPHMDKIIEKWYTKNLEITIDVIQYIDDKRVVFRVYPGMTDNDLIKEIII